MESIQCYKIWYMVNLSGKEVVPEEYRGVMLKTCQEECGKVNLQCREACKKMLFSSVNEKESK